MYLSEKLSHDDHETVANQIYTALTTFKSGSKCLFLTCNLCFFILLI